VIPESTHQELDRLGWHLSAGSLTHSAYQEALACILQRTFCCSTVALWLVSGIHGARTLSCQLEYKGAGTNTPGCDALSEAQFEKYYAALVARGVYACDDTRSDQNLSAMMDRYSRPDSPRAFLDVIVAINGCALAILSCCQSSAPRRWTLGEATTLRQLGARVALQLSRLNPSRFGKYCADARPPQ